MATWETPKTDWYGATAGGVYTGDRFNYTDYNRIKNNLIYLHDLAITLYDDFDIEDVGDDKTVADYPYADEINAIEQNLETINKNTLSQSYGDTKTYTANDAFINYTELNRLEKATLDLYDKITNTANGRRTLELNFGFKSGDF